MNNAPPRELFLWLRMLTMLSFLSGACLGHAQDIPLSCVLFKKDHRTESFSLTFSEQAQTVNIEGGGPQAARVTVDVIEFPGSFGRRVRISRIDGKVFAGRPNNPKELSGTCSKPKARKF